MQTSHQNDCPFCRAVCESNVIEQFGTVAAIKDKHPVTEGHVLVIPIRHTPDYFSMTENEKRDADMLLELLRDRIAQSDTTVTGFNIGINCGKSAGQTIYHAHIHLIPRRDGDTAAPKGGVRGVIPEKMGY
jgi:ATP adenylyltransferase